MGVDTVRQCPCCELRFANRNELDDHLRTNHITFGSDDVPGPPPVVAGTVAVPIDPTRTQTLAIVAYGGDRSDTITVMATHGHRASEAC